MNRPVTLALALLAALSVVALAAAHGSQIHADAQASADGVVVVESVTALEDGYVVLYADDGGEAGRPVGHAAVSAGRSTGVEVRIDPSWWQGVDRTTLHARLHVDDGDGEFDPGTDDAAVQHGATVSDTFAVANRDPANVVGPAAGWVSTTRPAVTVRRVTLPAPGFLVVRADAADGNESVLGATALPAGVTRNATVAIDETYFDRRERSFPVAATVYRDDGDGEFDADDEPVAVGDRPVETSFFVEPLAASPGQSAPTETATDGSETTAVGGTSGTDTGGPATTADGGATATDGQAGFGVGPALLGVAVAALVLRRRVLRG